mmetsp:Transcript_7689/g.21399  ORF Transcript_7689/g.21399 Transcript_7689/m.21399 type:complete len:189 (-) Transcript_7689:147-713(-)|eukprot:CAMPEP_0168770594 /NCGR_PEP_ID=MMETSP0725-20121227/3000_1 /TAXON_ID=265536 /ORGANISM="Amphiprora sp., Strain CCMP467" /LENGTH=188 /DNA_ID=CAMNT_0008820043 /DNA_START=46 /DNA_END=609 /DNA_ORIENTATION=-
MMKAIETFDIEDVCLWVFAIGLGEKADAFRENAVDGAMLLTLGDTDFAELGLSSLQGKKVLSSIGKTKALYAESGNGGGGAEIAALQQENARLKARIAELEGQLKPPAPAPKASAPPPPPAPSQQKPKNEHHVIKGAARGTARGAVLGAVAGAVAGDAGKGAKIGAATGATAGGMQGLAARRRARRGW